MIMIMLVCIVKSYVGSTQDVIRMILCFLHFSLISHSYLGFHIIILICFGVILSSFCSFFSVSKSSLLNIVLSVLILLLMNVL